MEHNRDHETIKKVYGNSKFADFPLNVDRNSQKNSSQGNQFIGITIYNQEKSLIAEFSIVTPEQPKHNKPIAMAILSLIPQADPDLTAYLNELLRRNEPEQQKNLLVPNS